MRVIHKINGREIRGQLIGLTFIPDGDRATQYGPDRVVFSPGTCEISFGGDDDDGGIMIKGFVSDTPTISNDKPKWCQLICLFYPI